MLLHQATQLITTSLPSSSVCHKSEANTGDLVTTPLHPHSLAYKLCNWPGGVQDPQDRGPGYRNVVGIPGGFGSELYKVFESKNKNNMKLVPGEGGEIRNGRATENDAVNTVYIVDSTALPFHQAEMCAPTTSASPAALPLL